MKLLKNILTSLVKYRARLGVGIGIAGAVLALAMMSANRAWQQGLKAVS